MDGGALVCDVGLVCDTAANTCVQGSGSPGLGSSCDGYCHEDTSIACNPGQQGFNCCGGGSAESDRCTAAGGDTYCCDEAPPCLAEPDV
jgi:hypothetical protein